MISQDYTDHYTIWCTKHSTHHPLYIQVCMNNVCVYSYIVYRISHMKSQSTYLKDIPFYLSTLLLTINRFQCVHVFTWDSLTNRCEDSAKSRHKYKRQLRRFCAATTSLWNMRVRCSSVCQSLLSDYQSIAV